jgi:hypothetical protein
MDLRQKSWHGKKREFDATIKQEQYLLTSQIVRSNNSNNRMQGALVCYQ